MTPAQLKADLNLSETDTHHDAKLSDMIDAATELFEMDTDRICLSSTFDLWIDALPVNEPIDLIKQFAHTIDKIEYKDTEGTIQEVDSSVYVLDSAANQIFKAYGQSWPEYIRYHRNVRIQFQAGYATREQVPRLYQQAIKCQAASRWIDPAMEQTSSDWLNAYERIILRLASPLEV